jgi:hypothetical protein
VLGGLDVGAGAPAHLAGGVRVAEERGDRRRHRGVVDHARVEAVGQAVRGAARHDERRRGGHRLEELDGEAGGQRPRNDDDRGPCEERPDPGEVGVRDEAHATGDAPRRRGRGDRARRRGADHGRRGRGERVERVEQRVDALVAVGLPT